MRRIGHSIQSNDRGSRHHRFVLLLAGMVTGLTFLAGFPRSASADVVIHSPEDVLASWTTSSAGRLFFRDPDGGLYEFITDIEDAAIINQGAGSFFAVDRESVQRAIDAVRYPLDELDIEVFLLPYPRRGLLDSSAGRAAIYLSPGVTPYQEYQVHSVTAHEIGHLVHNQLMGDEQSWARYRSLRGIEDESLYHAHAQHKNRPREIFAEDFRYLFGGSQAAYSGSIENPELPLPSSVPGLESFFLSLVAGTSTVQDLPVAERLRIFPNPTQGGVTIHLAREVPASDGAFSLRVFDAQGRMVSSGDVHASSGLRWEGITLDGRPAAPGLYFLQLARGDRRWVGKVLVSR